MLARGSSQTAEVDLEIDSLPSRTVLLASHVGNRGPRRYDQNAINYPGLIQLAGALLWYRAVVQAVLQATEQIASNSQKYRAGGECSERPGQVHVDRRLLVSGERVESKS